MKKLFNRLKKHSDDVGFETNDVNMGFDFINFLIKQGVSPLSLLGNKELTNKYLEKFNNERNGRNVEG